MTKSLDEKIERICNGSATEDFILADAKDGDMGFGIAAGGPNDDAGADRFEYRTLDGYRQAMRDVTKQGLIDIMLMSASTSEQLTTREKLFDGTSVTPAVPERMIRQTFGWDSVGTTRISCRCRFERPRSITSCMVARWSGTNSWSRFQARTWGLFSITFNNEAMADRESPVGLQ